MQVSGSPCGTVHVPTIAETKRNFRTGGCSQETLRPLYPPSLSRGREGGVRNTEVARADLSSQKEACYKLVGWLAG